MSIPPARSRREFLFHFGIYLSFFFCGFSSLLFEIIWSRQFVTIFGNSSYAISIVLCAYMAGVGIGGLWGGRLADRNINQGVVFSLILAGIAVCALGIPAVLGQTRLAAPGISALFSNSLLISNVVRFIVSFAILIVPCFLMGTTLPLLARAVTDKEKMIGSSLGFLYCVNTLGAGAGCLAGGFWLISSFGLWKTNLIAVIINFIIAGFALSFSYFKTAAKTDCFKEPEKPRKHVEPQISSSILLIIGFINGLAALACEVFWIRYMSFMVNSTYVFPTILCIYLLGAGAGSLIYGLFARRIKRPAQMLAMIELLMAIFVPAAFIASALVFINGSPPAVDQKVIAVLAVFVPTVLMGFAFPLLCTVYASNLQTLGRRTGLLFAVNTAGTVLGSLLPIFIFIPIFGIQMSLLVISLFYGLAGIGLLFLTGSVKGIIKPAVIYGAAIFLFFGLVPGDICRKVFLATDFNLARHTDILFYKEGRTGTAVLTNNRINNCKTVYINGVSEVPLLYPHKICFKMIGDLGPMLHPAPDDVLMICFGGGIAAGATAVLPDVKSLTIVDLEQSVIDAAALLSKENNNLLKNPKAKVIIDDGRDYIANSTRKWAVIISDSTHPKSGDSWVLYTKEFYQQVRNHLTADGVFVEWVPIHNLRIEEFKIIVRSFQNVFPHTSLWFIGGSDEQACFVSYVLLAATPDKLKIDINNLAGRLDAEAVGRDLEAYGLDTPAGFLDSFICGEESLRKWTGEGPINTDDLPFTQYKTRYSKSPVLRNNDFAQIMQDIWPFLINTGSDEQANRLHESLIVRANVNRLTLSGQIEKGYSLLPDDIRYEQLNKMYERGPIYLNAIAELFWDKPRVLKAAALLRLSSKGGLQGAIPIYQRILTLEPKNVEALNALGAIYIRANLPKQAQNYLETAVKERPDNVAARYNLGLAMFRQGLLSQAVPHLRYCLSKDPCDAAVKNMLQYIDNQKHLAGQDNNSTISASEH